MAAVGAKQIAAFNTAIFTDHVQASFLSGQYINIIPPRAHFVKKKRA
jgi:hypothetical protein